MTRGVSASKLDDSSDRGTVPGDVTVTVPTDTLARLERLATTSVLASGLAHEIANPLSCLTAAVDALQSRLGQLRDRGGATSAELEQLASDVELAAVGGKEIFDVVRDFQHYLRPKDLQTAAAIDVKPSIVRALRMARGRLEATTPVSISLSEAPAVRMPAHRITQVVLNLLLNAADAVEGRPWSANLVEVRLDTVGGWAVIDVKDNGPGLDPEVRKNLFEAGTSSKRGGSGMGLGLAICRALVRQSGGEISVSSPITPGTIFRVVLPPAG